MARWSSQASAAGSYLPAAENAGPLVRVEFEPPAGPIGAGQWRCGWRIRNVATPILSMTTAWLPHGRFRSARRTFDPAVKIAAGSSKRMSFDVECSEVSGTELENAFVILTADLDGEEWRVFARLTVSFGDGGLPTPRTEIVTTSRVVFTNLADPRGEASL